ncbi:hypothetical protein [Qipengyuania sphaerica]|uniref:hypothetical protein n=1 Tax=Qipengyuania sphaerica TaxID=2867243 RepID=UPI001C86D762|nr:hypothetical protein [Qipengyuania sphaerica]MBX7541289.1 hypothetical protein [Qipengyuania sphaerica]
MNIDSRSIGILAVATLGLGACTTSDGKFGIAPNDPSWGEANRVTMAAQVIDPSPEYENPIPPTSASNAVRAIDAYREGKVEEVEDISTTESISNGGGPN